MILKLNSKQSAKVRDLARRECCNCVDGNCLLPDDGEPCRCVQLISRYGIYCAVGIITIPDVNELIEAMNEMSKSPVNAA